MNRRNTIIIAVLVNAGLLLILFATSLRSGSKKEDSSVKLAEAPIPAKENSSTPVTTEELLNEYIATSHSDQEDVIVLEDLVNGTSTIESVSQNSVAVSASPDSSLPAVQSAASPQGSLASVNTLEKQSLPKASVNPPVSTPKPSLVPASVNLAPAKETLAEMTVKKGDCLEKIAKANNTSVNALMQANHLSSTNLKVGQILKIPTKEKASESHAPLNKDFYVVKEGDSPWLIASKCQIKLDELLRMNNIDEQKAKKLRPGDKLRIR